MKYRLPNTLALSSYGRNIEINYVSSKECSIDLDSDLVGINSISAIGTKPIIFKLDNFGDTRNLCVDTDALYCDKIVSGNIADYTLGKSDYWFNTSYIDSGNFNNLEVSSTANITSIYCRDVTSNIIFTDDMYVTDLYASNILPQSNGSSDIGSYSDYFGEVHATSLMLHSGDDDSVMYRIQVLTRSMESTLEIYSATDINALLNGWVDLDLPYGMKITTQGDNQEEIKFVQIQSENERISFMCNNLSIMHRDTYNPLYTCHLTISYLGFSCNFTNDTSSSCVSIENGLSVNGGLDVKFGNKNLKFIDSGIDFSNLNTIGNSSIFNGLFYGICIPIILTDGYVEPSSHGIGRGKNIIGIIKPFTVLTVTFNTNIVSWNLDMNVDGDYTNWNCTAYINLVNLKEYQSGSRFVFEDGTYLYLPEGARLVALSMNQIMGVGEESQNPVNEKVLLFVQIYPPED